MKKPSHPFLHWPGSLLWLLPLFVSILLFWRDGAIDTIWWYLIVPPLVALTLIDLFSTVWFGISTLTLLFLYSSIGSSGAPVSFAIWEPTAWVNVREMRGLEMTEFEWFHWWPFKWLIAILCLNMSIVTVRKIKLTILTVGVWTIHTGVIITVLGCLVYFSQKTEGDVIVSRRVVEIQTSDGKPVSMVVTPSNTITVGDTSFTITDINPSWELMSGDDAGKIAYTVTVSVQGPENSFMRQLIAGYPEYTEDIVNSGDPKQPMARAKKVLGRALVDESLQMSLGYDAKDVFYVTQSGAIYLRELSSDETPLSPWVERPIHNLPRFNDYISAVEDVWMFGGTHVNHELHPLALPVPRSVEIDPVDDDIIIKSYLRYAYMDPRIQAGGSELFPVVWVTLRKGDEVAQSVELYAFDPKLNTADTSLMAFQWIESDSELTELEDSIMPSLEATVAGVTFTLAISPSEEFTAIGDTEYTYKINSVQNNLKIAGTVVSLALVQLQRGEEEWERWVFDNPVMTRDVIEGVEHDVSTEKFVDENIKMTYSSGTVPITVVGGLENNKYIMLTSIHGNALTKEQLVVGEPTMLTGGITITIDRGDPYTYQETKPAIVPPIQRDPSASNMYSMVQVVIPTPEGTVTTWLPYHHYAFESTRDIVARFKYNPTKLRLPNGKMIEIMFSRERVDLPSPVVLERFEVDAHLGGFTGSTSSILNWRSIVRFLDASDTSFAVSVNDPQSYGEYWFFQSQWDPPDNASQGLNYTVLGIGNRHGVLQMLLGCCLTVSGMIWAFYVKPMIKRKRQQVMYAGVSS